MAIDPAGSLAAYLGDVPASQFLNDCAAQADELVTRYIAGFGTPDIPTTIITLSVNVVGAELYHRRNAPNGVANYSDGMGGTIPMRVARDPMVAARPILAPYVGLAIG